MVLRQDAVAFFELPDDASAAARYAMASRGP
jgi:hypothetical protein